jgi:hypothetical protein
VSFRCAYCIRVLDDTCRSIEHVVPRALGGSLTTERVCRVCNNRVGQEVDEPLVRSFLVRQSRHRYQVPDPRSGHCVPAPRLDGVWEDGTRGFLEFGGDEIRGVVVSEAVRVGDAAWRVAIPDDAPDDLLPRVLRRLEKRENAVAHVGCTAPMPEQTVTANYTMRMEWWPRFGAKVGLVVGSSLFGDDWLDQEAAKDLHQTLWNRPVEKGQLPPIPTRVAGSGIESLFAPPEHVVGTMPAYSSGLRAMICLFGELLYAVPLGRDAEDWSVWVLDPLERTRRKISHDEWMLEAVGRANDRQP